MSRITLGESRERVVKDQWLFTAGRRRRLHVCVCVSLLIEIIVTPQIYLKHITNCLFRLESTCFFIKFQFELSKVVKEMNGLIGQ